MKVELIGEDRKVIREVEVDNDQLGKTAIIRYGGDWFLFCQFPAERMYGVAVFQRVTEPLELGGYSLTRSEDELKHAAQMYEDAAHMNETEMDACVEDVAANDGAKAIRVRAVALNAHIQAELAAE